MILNYPIFFYAVICRQIVTDILQNYISLITLHSLQENEKELYTKKPDEQTDKAPYHCAGCQWFCGVFFRASHSKKTPQNHRHQHISVSVNS